MDLTGAPVKGVERIGREGQMTWLLISIAVVALVGLLAVMNGADTSDSDDWATHPRM